MRSGNTAKVHALILYNPSGLSFGEIRARTSVPPNVLTRILANLLKSDRISRKPPSKKYYPPFDFSKHTAIIPAILDGISVVLNSYAEKHEPYTVIVPVHELLSEIEKTVRGVLSISNVPFFAV